MVADTLSLGRSALRLLSWAIGVMLILLGLAIFAVKPSFGSLAAGLGCMLCGLVLVPPFVSRVRDYLPFARPIWVPPLASLAVFFITVFVSGPIFASSPEGIAQAEADRVLAAASRASEIAEIERLVSEGSDESITLALRKLEAGQFRDDVAAGGSLRPLLDQATTAAQAVRARGQVADYISSVNDMLPKVEAVFTGRPETDLVINLNLQTLDTAARLLEKGEAHSSQQEVREAMTKLRSTMIQKQIAAFPAMRAGYGRIKGKAVWENDMEITVQGGGNRTIRFIAGMFAANRNIAQFEQDVRSPLSQMRFRRTQYEWYRGSEYTYYTLEVPQDSEVGYWNNAIFTPVPSPG